MPNNCPNCGKPLDQADVSCPGCGNHLPGTSDPRAQKAAVVAATLLPIIGIILFTLIAGGIALAGMMMLRHVRLPVASHQASNQPLSQVPPMPAQIPADLPTSQPVLITAPAITPPPQFITAPVPPPAATAPPQILLQTPAQIPEVTIPSPPAPPVVALPSPTISSFDPPIVPPGQSLTIHGENLAKTRTVTLIDSRGAGMVNAKITSRTDDNLIVTIPNVPFPDHGIFLAVYSPAGVAVLVEEHLGNTPWGTDGHLHHTAINVRSDDQVVVLDHMVVFAMSQSTVSMGDNCVGFFSNNVTLKSVGKNCIISYVDPLHRPDDTSNSRLLKKPSIELICSGEPFRVKPAPPDSDQ